MKRLLAYLFIVLGLGLVLIETSFAGYKVKVRDQNGFGTVLTMSPPLANDKLSKWNNAFKKAQALSIKHCELNKKNTYVFWSQRKDIFARNSKGNLISWITYSDKNKKYGYVQDQDQANPLKGGYRFRYFCAKDVNEAHEIFKNYFIYFNYYFKSNIRTYIVNEGGTLHYSEINSNPYKFENFFKKAEKKIKPKPKKKKTENDSWTAIFAHPKSRNDFHSQSNSKQEALLKALSKCKKFVTLSAKKRKLYSYDNCKLKLAIKTANNKYYVNLLWQGENINTIKSKYNLTAEKIDKIKKTKYELEQKNINKYINILRKGKTLANQYLEKETLKNVRIAKYELEQKNINKYISILHQGKTLANQYLEKETLKNIPEKKLKYEEDDIEKYLQANLKGSDLNEFYLEKETIELVKVKRQERREILYAKTCTGVIFGHKKGTFKWYKCLEEKEQEELFKGTEIKIVKKNKAKPLKSEKIIKTTSTDNEAPILQVVEILTVTDPSYSIEGKVTDKGSDKIYLKVDGRDIPVTKGKFKINRYSPVDENIKITAIDKWGNEVTKIIKVSVNIEGTTVAGILEPLNASKIRSKSSSNKVALIIGIENYTEAPKADYANLDAKYFYDYAIKAFGVKKQNINMLIDQDASLSKTYTALFKWLPGKIKPNKTDLIIFFSGHGLASSDGKEKYILPNNADPDLLSKTALSRNELFDQIVKLKPKSVIMFFDTCYSGVSRDEQTLLASAKPIRIVADDDKEIPDNFTIFTASKGDQISSGLKEAKHGIFSYYLMKGLEGKADQNKDNKITNGELLAYLDQNVSERALDLGRQQNPSLAGDPDKILMSYR